METETGRQRKPGTDRDKQTHIQTKAKNDGYRQRRGDRQREERTGILPGPVSSQSFSPAMSLL